MRTPMTICGLLLSQTVWADTAYWDYGDWRVTVETTDTGQDLRADCLALTCGDGVPMLQMALSNGDVDPPAWYPLPMAVEHALRGFDTNMQNGQPIQVEQADGVIVGGEVMAGIDDQGYAWAQAEPDQRDALTLLRA